MNLVMKPALGQARGPKTDSGIRQRPLKAFMDDLTVTTESVISARYVLRSLSKAASWARMKFKAKKCRKLVMRRGKICDKLQLEVQGERIPAIAEQPIKSLGKTFDVTLSDKKNIEEFKQQMRDGLEAIENSELPGRYKVWCYQYGLLPRAVWPMTMYDIPLTVVEEVERRVSRHLRKWLGVPPGLTSIGLYSKTAKLQLPLTSMEEEYKVTKARAQLMLQESRDELVSQAGIRLRSGKKWAAAEAVASATSRLKHRDIVGVVAQGRRGFGAEREGTQRWGTASPRERRELIQKEVRQQEEEVQRSRAVSQGVQGAWTRWEGVRERKRWRKKDEDKCKLCGKTGNLSHVLTSCPVALGKGRYTWRHNQVLKVIASAVEEQITENKVKGKQRKGLQKTTQVVLLELTVPWEDRMEEANERKRMKYQELASRCREKGWKTWYFQVEVGCRGFIGQTMWKALGHEWPSLSPRWLETYCNKGRNVKESQFAADDGEWRAESDPLYDQWKDADLVSIYKKKGDRATCSNSRGISLLSSAGKVGSVLNASGDISDEVQRRIGLASASFGSLANRVFLNKDLTTKTKVAWWHKVPHGESRRRAHVEPLETLLLQRQLRWAGHVIRMPGNRLPRHILYGELTNGSRSVGGQHKRYKDNLKTNLKKCGLQPHRLEEAAAERSRWRQECATGITTYTAEYNRLREERRQRRHHPPSSTGEHACDVCGRICLSRIGLVSHRRTHRSDVIVGNDGQP
ncbi:hypothetical protein Bbelb_155700 [Branchiostoma belcheri]|nr:hypothetical protein Bbelb_155700 [Branchiostoma belcheri]